MTSTSSARSMIEIRHRLAHPDPGDLGDDVIQAFDMLDVERRVDVDAARQNLLDVEIALRMAAALGIGVGEFIDQHQRRSPRQDGVEVHLPARGRDNRPSCAE